MYYVSNRARSAGKLCAKKAHAWFEVTPYFSVVEYRFCVAPQHWENIVFPLQQADNILHTFFCNFHIHTLQCRVKWTRFQSLQTFQIFRIIGTHICFARTEKDLIIWNVLKLCGLIRKLELYLAFWSHSNDLWQMKSVKEYTSQSILYFRRYTACIYIVNL